MENPKQGSSAKTILSIVVLFLALIGAIGFGYWAFSERQDYKNNVDEKIAAAVVVAEKAQAEKLQKQYDEESKKPNKTYTGPATYGSLTFNYPRTWSAYVDETDKNKPIDAYFHPTQVPGVQSETAYALRVELINTPYAEALKTFDQNIKAGKTKVSAYVPPKMAQIANVQPGSKVDGTINTNQSTPLQGSLVLIKARDKTLQISTQSNDYLADFNNIVLATLTFVP